MNVSFGFALSTLTVLSPSAARSFPAMVPTAGSTSAFVLASAETALSTEPFDGFTARSCNV